jgi:predicted Fe-Mo cluster-binding NifX family protein
MIVIISAQKPIPDSPVEERFGRAPWFVQINTETNQWEALPNPGIQLSGGAGVAAAQFVIDQKANAVISGDFGPHAARALREASIGMALFGGSVSTVQEASEQYAQGKLQAFV